MIINNDWWWLTGMICAKFWLLKTKLLKQEQFFAFFYGIFSIFLCAQFNIKKLWLCKKNWLLEGLSSCDWQWLMMVNNDWWRSIMVKDNWLWSSIFYDVRRRLIIIVDDPWQLTKIDIDQWQSMMINDDQ